MAHENSWIFLACVGFFLPMVITLFIDLVLDLIPLQILC